MTKLHKRISGEARAHNPFDIGCDHAPAISDPPRAGQAVLQWRHARTRLQRIAWGDHQPNLIQAKRPHGLPRNMDMPGMSRVEGPAQKANAAPAAIAETGWSHGTRIRVFSADVNWPAKSPQRLFVHKRRVVQVYFGEFILLRPIILIMHPFGLVAALR